MQRKDLLMVFALMFNPELSCSENKRLSFLSDLVREGYNEVSNSRLIRNISESGTRTPQKFRSTLKLLPCPNQQRAK